MLISSFAEVRQALASLPGPEPAAAIQAEAREAQLTKPAGALGRLETLSTWLASWQHRYPPTLNRPVALVFAANHGVTAHGVSAYPSDVTEQMVRNFRNGGAAVNQLCETFGVALSIYPLDLDQPTRDFTVAPAMDESEAAAAISTGLEAVPADADLVCLGEMGIGNTTAAAALSHALFGGTSADWTGAGTGIEGAVLDLKRRVVAKAVLHHRQATTDPLELLARLGGRELAAILGAAVGARLRGIPVLLDGYVVTAAVAPLAVLRADALDHALAAHCSAEPGHRLLLSRLGKQPLLDLGMRLGEASGAVLAVGVLRGALACHLGMATFAEASVSGRSGSAAGE